MFKAGIFLNLKKMFTVTKDKTELVQWDSMFLDKLFEPSNDVLLS